MSPQGWALRPRGQETWYCHSWAEVAPPARLELLSTLSESSSWVNYAGEGNILPVPQIDQGWPSLPFTNGTNLIIYLGRRHNYKMDHVALGPHIFSHYCFPNQEVELDHCSKTTKAFELTIAVVTPNFCWPEHEWSLDQTDFCSRGRNQQAEYSWLACLHPRCCHSELRAQDVRIQDSTKWIEAHHAFTRPNARSNTVCHYLHKTQASSRSISWNSCRPRDSSYTASTTKTGLSKFGTATARTSRRATGGNLRLSDCPWNSTTS